MRSGGLGALLWCLNWMLEPRQPSIEVGTRPAVVQRARRVHSSDGSGRVKAVETQGRCAALHWAAPGQLLSGGLFSESLGLGVVLFFCLQDGMQDGDARVEVEVEVGFS